MLFRYGKRSVFSVAFFCVAASALDDILFCFFNVSSFSFRFGAFVLHVNFLCQFSESFWYVYPAGRFLTAVVLRVD